MKKTTLLSVIAGATIALAVSPAAKAVVTPLDTFSYDLIGGNTNSGDAYYLTAPATATFGATTTTAGAGYDGQDITITSSETLGAGTTTDTFTISTPTNFLTDDSIDGTTINALQFDIGDSNSGGNPVNLVLPLDTYTATGSIIDGTDNTAAIGTNTTAPTGATSYYASLGPNTGSATTPIDSFTVHSITYSITYTSEVPEPATWAMLALGAVVACIAVMRNRRAAA